MPGQFLNNLRLRIKALLSRRKLDRDLDDELRFHLAMKREKLERNGLSSPDAEHAAARRFGNPVLIREESRNLWSFTSLEAAARDIQYAFRGMLRAPLFAAIAIITLAFAIGVNTAMFSVVNGILLKAMPYEKPDEIYSIREVVESGSMRHVASAVNGGNVLEWRKRSHSFAAIAALEPSSDTIARGSQTVHAHGLRASASLFPLLGVSARIGRTFAPQQDEMGHGMEIVMTDSLWREHFAADPAIVGQKVSLNSYPVTVIGILPPSFYFPKQDQIYGSEIAGWTFPVQYFLNLNLGPGERSPGVGIFNFAAIGRLRQGASARQAQGELATIEFDIARQIGSEVSLNSELVPFKAGVIRGAESRIWALMSGAGLVLLIVCVNLAGLTLGRNAARAREVAIRLALGAGRWTVIRQFAAEGLILGVVGGALGVLAANAALRLIVRLAPITLPRLETVAIDDRVLLFSTVVALAAGLSSCLLPALRLRDRTLEQTLRSSTLNLSSSRANVFVHDLLVGSEIAICTVLLICALLLGGSLRRVLLDNAWFDEERVVAADIEPSPKNYQSAADRVDLYRRVIHDVQVLPGVRSAGLTTALPLRGEAWGSNVDIVEIPTPGTRQPNANFRFVSPGYAEAIGLKLLSGRTLADTDAGRKVAMISESLVRFYGGRDLNGMHMNWSLPGSSSTIPLEITGVVRDFRGEAEGSPVPAVYIPYWIWPAWTPSIVARTDGDAAGLTAGIRGVLQREALEVPITRVETLRQVLDGAVASRKFITLLGASFAGCATILAALGLYGVISLAASRRRREIAIRVAIGASSPDVLGMILGKAARITFAAVIAGVLFGTLVARAIASQLYQASVAEPGVYLIAAGIAIAVALTASILPALRATRVDPVVVLKYD